jgi:HD superfamily phosphodiesterase
MDWLDWEPILRKEAAIEMKKAPSISPVHGMDHLERVRDRCVKMGVKLDTDLEVLMAAAYLHDLGRHYNLEVHGMKSARLAKPILKKIGFPKEKISQVLEVITLHDHNVDPRRRKTIEAQILYDADKLDAFGAIGAARWVMHGYARGKSIPWIVEKIKKRYAGLHLAESKELAREPYQYTIDFFRKLSEDVKTD